MQGYLFLYSQDLSNCTTDCSLGYVKLTFLYSQDLSNGITQSTQSLCYRAVLFRMVPKFIFCML